MFNNQYLFFDDEQIGLLASKKPIPAPVPPVPSPVPLGAGRAFGGGVGLRIDAYDDPSEWISKIDKIISKKKSKNAPNDVFEKSKKVEEAKQELHKKYHLEALKKRIKKLEDELQKRNLKLRDIRKLRRRLKYLQLDMMLAREKFEAAELERKKLIAELEQKELESKLEKELEIAKRLAEVPSNLPIQKKPVNVFDVIGAGFGWYVGAAISAIATYYLVPDDKKELKFTGYSISGVLGFIGLSKSLSKSKEM